MDLHRLRAFYTVATTGSFTRAATRLHLTQPSVSRQVKSLEEELRVSLLERRPRQLILTPEGEILMHHVERLFDNVDEIEGLFRDISKMKKTKLQMAGNESTAMHVLPPTLEKFSKKYPFVELGIHTMRTGEIIAKVRDGSMDLGFTLGPPRQPDLECVPIQHYELVFITPRQHPLARKTRISLEDIAAFPIISYTSDRETRSIIERPLRQKKLSLDVKMELGNTDLIVTYVELGYGVAVVHNLGLQKRRARNLSLHSLRAYFEPGWVNCIFSRSHNLTRAAEAFLEMLKAGQA